jgi:hypothetical protein
VSTIVNTPDMRQPWFTSGQPAYPYRPASSATRMSAGARPSACRQSLRSGRNRPRPPQVFAPEISACW